MSTDQYQEILIVIVSSVFVFVTLVIVLVYSMLYHQKKKFQYLKDRKKLAETFEKQLLQAKLEVQKETFDQISAELHDHVGQLLSLTKIQVNILEQKGKLDQTLLDDIKTNMGQAMADIRGIAKSLNSVYLQQIPLEQAIDDLLQRINRNEGKNLVRCYMNVHGTAKEFSFQRKIMLFRIVQEGLQNVLKHANATRVDISVTYSDERLIIIMVDDGVGFDQKQMEFGGLGLHNITTRTSLIGGQADIHSAPEHGTTITLEIPYD